MKAQSEIVSFLKAKVGLFAGFSDERLKALVDQSQVVSFEANEAIDHYGAAPTHLGVAEIQLLRHGGARAPRTRSGGAHRLARDQARLSRTARRGDA